MATSLASSIEALRLRTTAAVLASRPCYFDRHVWRKRTKRWRQCENCQCLVLWKYRKQPEKALRCFQKNLPTQGELPVAPAMGRNPDMVQVFYIAGELRIAKWKWMDGKVDYRFCVQLTPGNIYYYASIASEKALRKHLRRARKAVAKGGCVLFLTLSRGVKPTWWRCKRSREGKQVAGCFDMAACTMGCNKKE